MSSLVFTREEVAKHNSHEDAWIIVDDKVYDISKWSRKHPGGKVITYYRGEDATEPVKAFHPDMPLIEKYMKALYIGTLEEESYKKMPSEVADFRALRRDLEKEGYFYSSKPFYILHLLQIFVLEILGVYVMYNWGSHWWAFFATAVILAVSQIQAGWLQHDFGHLSVFYKKRGLNSWMHHFTIGFLKAASSHWWKSRHNRHHAKTNIARQDPDIHTEPVFFWDIKMAEKTKNHFVKNQDTYWWFFGPPSVTTLLFVYQNLLFVVSNSHWIDLFFVISYFARYFYTYSFFLSIKGCFGLYFTMRLIESHWFTWVTSMNHLPRDIKHDKDVNWIVLHTNGTQNVNPSAFNDWFTGHLNYQIEHHLFPTMPRHNYPVVAQRVQALCKKHKLSYTVKSMKDCCQDILNKLVLVAKSTTTKPVS